MIGDWLFYFLVIGDWKIYFLVMEILEWYSLVVYLAPTTYIQQMSHMYIKLFSVPWGYIYLHNCNSYEYVIKHVKLAMLSSLMHSLAILSRGTRT